LIKNTLTCAPTEIQPAKIMPLSKQREVSGVRLALWQGAREATGLRALAHVASIEGTLRRLSGKCCRLSRCAFELRLLQKGSFAIARSPRQMGPGIGYRRSLIGFGSVAKDGIAGFAPRVDLTNKEIHSIS